MAITRDDDKGSGGPFSHAEQQAILPEGERGLRASEERLRRSLEAAGFGHWDYDYVRDTVVWSAQTRKLLEVEPSEPASRALLRSRVYPEDRPRFDEHIARSAYPKSDHLRHFEFRVVMPNGAIRWLEDQDWVEMNAAGIPVRTVGVLRDITERKNAEDAQACLAAIVTSSADAIVGKTLDGIVTNWNEAAKRMFGYSAGEMIGQSIRCLIPADRQAEEDMILACLARSETIAHFETKRLAKDGRIFDASIIVSPVRHADGRVIGAAKIIRDISERMRAEAQTAADLRAMTTLREIGNLYVRNDLQTAECLQRTIGAAITIVGADKGTLQVFDVSSNSLVIAAHRGFAEPFLTFFKHVSSDASACAAAMQTKGQVVVEDILHSDIFIGQESQAVLIGAGVRAVVCTPLMTSNGTVVGMISTHYSNPHRPTDREIYLIEVLARQAADYLERKRAEQLQKTLLSELNHRCNNLFSVVQAVANQSLSGHDTLDEARTVFIARLQALALANQHILNSDWSGVELHELIESELEPFRMSVRVEGNPVTIRAQKVQNFALVLHELVTNAAKYGALSIPAGKVQISWAITRASGNTTLHFRWRESGGPRVVAPRRQGFGVMLLKGVFPGIRLDYLEEGLDCAFEMPL